MTEEEKQRRLQEIKDRAGQIQREAALSLLVRALTVGLAFRAGSAFGVAAGGVTSVGASLSAEGDVKNFMKELVSLEREKNELLNQSADPSAFVTVPEVIISASVNNESNRFTIPETTITADETTNIVTIPEVVITDDGGSITIPEVVITGEPEPGAEP
jgi:hypothetical protein